jgi:hypothetical protein
VVLPFSVFATAEVATREANTDMAMMVFMEVSPDWVAPHTVSDVRSHLAGVNARGKSSTRIASTMAEGAARYKKAHVNKESFELHSSKRRMLLSWDFGMADAGCDPFYARWNCGELRVLSSQGVSHDWRVSWQLASEGANSSPYSAAT